MPDVAIKVDNLSKSYLVGHIFAHHNDTFREMIVRNTHDFVRKTKDMLSGKPIIQGDEIEEFWALNDVSFEIKKGDRVGIIGRNGAGKSTLLKVLSRITEPTNGRIEINGRVASLLEVGTGFHSELTGRENIYLNGAILGMTRKEIQARFDEIVTFAEVEKFLDTPVKRYSSGMYVRLAFAIAAHLEPEVLIVDEVLAVGDAQFQKKCLGKMEEAGKEGRTVLFVSHNMAAISGLCRSGIYLNGGGLQKIGEIDQVISFYLKDNLSLASEDLFKRPDRRGNGIVKFSSVEILDSDRRNITTLLSGQLVFIRVRMKSNEANSTRLNNINFAIGIDDSRGQRVCHLGTHYVDNEIKNINTNSEDIVVKLPRMQLVPGAYSMTLFLTSSGTVIDWISNAYSFNVEAGDFYNSGKLPPTDQGVFLADFSIDVEGNHA